MKPIIKLIVLSMLVVGCSSVKVAVDYDRSVDFSVYQTFEFWGWKANSDQIMNRFDKERIEQAVAREFNQRGIERVEMGQGDLIVSLYIVTEEKTKQSAVTTHMGGGYGGRYRYGPGYNWGVGHSVTQVHEIDYLEGTLIISVCDAENDVLIWEAVGRGTINEDPASREEKVGKVIARIMRDYPIQPTR